MKQRKTKREFAEEWIQQDRLEATEGKLRSARENQVLAIEILELLNQRVVKSDVIERIAELVRSSTGIEAVGVRLREGDDFPYLVAIGFPDDFIKAENFLCSRNGSGEIIRDSEGNPVLECMCGEIIRGKTDPSMPFITAGGSFWTDSRSKLMESGSRRRDKDPVQTPVYFMRL